MWIWLAVILAPSLALAPLAAEAQQVRLYRVGVILPGGSYSPAVDGRRDGLKELGLEQDKDFVLKVRDIKGDLKSVEAAARALEEERVDLVITVTTSVTLAAKRATKSVRIVFWAGGDPVVFGLLDSYRKPGGRLTGIHGQGGDLTPKRLQLLKELLPKLRRVVTFYNPDSPVAQRSVKMARDAARQLKVELVERPVASIDELRAGLRSLRIGEVDAFCYVADAMVNSHSLLVVETARAKKLPTMFNTTGAVTEGALASYGVRNYDYGRLAAKHVERVLLGADPAGLPVEQVDKFYFAINLKTAKALGLTSPQSVLVRADEIIQ
jgi:putative tryptophan/tyrosine transport system substrate-binding protein